MSSIFSSEIRRIHGFLCSVFIPVTLFLGGASSAYGADLPSLDQVFRQERAELRGEFEDPSERENHQKLVESLIRYLYSEDLQEQYQAEVSLRKIVTPEDLPRLLKEIPPSADFPVSEQRLIGVIGSLGDTRALGALQKEFELSKRDVQLSIIDALGEIRDDSVVLLLSNLLRRTQDSEYHKRTLAALAKIGGEKASYAIQSSLALLPEGVSRRAGNWSLTVAKRELKTDSVDTEFKPSLPSTLVYKGTLYYFYRPVSVHSDSPDPWLLVGLHGGDLGAKEIFDLCLPIAKKYKLALLVPFFDPVFFPDYHLFNLRGIRSDQRLFELMDFVGKNAKVKVKEGYFFGVDRGGEFLQRLIFAHPSRIARAAFLTPNFLSLSDAEFFPLGIRATAEAPELQPSLHGAIKSDFAILGDPPILTGKAYRSFYNGLADYAEREQMVSRVRYRELKPDQIGLVGVWEVATRYLFPLE